MEYTASLHDYIVLSCILFGIGCVGFLTRRNALFLFMFLELMLNDTNLLFVAFSHFRGEMDGQVVVFFIYALAAAEVAVGLAVMISLFRHLKDVDLDKIRLMKW